MTAESRAATWGLEQGAMSAQHVDHVSPMPHEVQLSLAISVKRIADAIDGTTLGVDISESLAGITSAIVYGKHK